VKLIRAELARLFARRFTRIALVGVLLLLAGIATVIWITNHKPTPADRLSAHIAAEQALTERNAAYQQCVDAQSRTPSPGATDSGAKQFPPGFDCHQITDYPSTDADFLPASFRLAAAGPDLFRALGALLALFGFAVGASFIGAEWSSGGILTLLLWRPNRTPVWLGKLGSLLLGVLGVGVVYSVLWYATLWVLADNRGSSALTAGALRSLALVDVRAITLALVAATVGYAVSALGRNTATALGAAVAWVVIFEVGTRIILGLMNAARPERWLLSSYVQAWLTNGARFFDESKCHNGPDPCVGVWWRISAQQSALVGVTLLVVVTAVSLYSFRRRDVT